MIDNKFVNGTHAHVLDLFTSYLFSEYECQLTSETTDTWAVCGPVMWLLQKPGVTYIEGEKHEEAYDMGTLIIDTSYCFIVLNAMALNVQ